MSSDNPNINVKSHVKPPSMFNIQELLLSPSNGINLSRTHKLIHCHRDYLITESRGSMFVIEVLYKIWRPKVQNKYTPPDYAINIYDGVFCFDFYSKTVFRPKIFGKRSSANTLSILPRTYIKRRYRRTHAPDRTLTHKHVLELQI